MQANQTEMQAVEAAVITNKIAALPTVTVPLSSLVKSKFNVRKQKLGGIEALAENIAETGLLQNLLVHEQTEGRKTKSVKYGVAGGQRRHAALDLLAAQGRLPADFPVDVKIVSAADALVISMSENTQREAMHPADQIDAFKAMVDDGKSSEYIATIFGITALTVERRLKLANASPKLHALLRDDQISPEQLAALCLSDDHETQERVWDNTKTDWMREPARLREAIAGNRINARKSNLAMFVGLAAFEAAGGRVDRDLFSNDGDAYIENGELLQELANQKLEEAADQIRAEGWAWVETLPSLDYSYRSRFATVNPATRPLTDAEQAEMQTLTARLKELESLIGDDEEEMFDDEMAETGLTAHEGDAAIELTHDEYAALQQEAATIAARIEEINNCARHFTDELKATAGVLVHLNYQGGLEIERGFVRRADQSKAVAVAGEQVRNLRAEKVKAVHSEKLMMELSAAHTIAVQAELVAAPNVALAVLAHRLSERALYIGGGDEHPAKISLTKASHRLDEFDAMQGNASWKAMEAATKKWKKDMPKQSDARFKWLLTQPQETLIELLAFLTAMSVDGIHGAEDQAPLAQIAKAVDLDMSSHWTATSDNYFSHVSKTRIVEVVSEAVSADEGAKLETMKKGEAAAAAEKALRDAGSKWLPPTLRTKAEKAAKKEKKVAAPEVPAAAATDDAAEATASTEVAAAWPWPTGAKMNAEAQQLAA